MLCLSFIRKIFLKSSADKVEVESAEQCRLEISDGNHRRNRDANHENHDGHAENA